MAGMEVFFSSFFKSIALISLVSLSVHLFYKVLNWAWIRPKRLERILREQGFRGNAYRPLLGDQYESGKLIREAMSRPIAIDQDANKRIIPHIIKSVEKHGKKSFMWVGRIPRVLVTDPEHVREIYTKYYLFQKNHHDLDPITKLLLTGIGSLEGEVWNSRRKILNPAFYYEKLKLLPPAFYSCCREMVAKWEAKVLEGSSTEVEVLHDIETLTVDVMSKTLFGCDVDEGRAIFKLMNELTNLTIDVILSVYIPGKR
ncbi:OLC1v1013678C1 [Oldenlandia corymbosa var. corymbosa]|uniref:OLC1v1013678C1 n=1 Tax=Oldenlandia corymbosa var. corymbosa TaxID=529605 RepID=A0AAV1DZ31_OLDCO|nr:OLC1v1013678C1 [Oldenlandia corymbosa var. corymbosa]